MVIPLEYLGTDDLTYGICLTPIFGRVKPQAKSSMNGYLNKYSEYIKNMNNLSLYGTRRKR